MSGKPLRSPFSSSSGSSSGSTSSVLGGKTPGTAGTALPSRRATQPPTQLPSPQLVQPLSSHILPPHALPPQLQPQSLPLRPLPRRPLPLRPVPSRPLPPRPRPHHPLPAQPGMRMPTAANEPTVEPPIQVTQPPEQEAQALDQKQENEPLPGLAMVADLFREPPPKPSPRISPQPLMIPSPKLSPVSAPKEEPQPGLAQPQESPRQSQGSRDMPSAQPGHHDLPGQAREDRLSSSAEGSSGAPIHQEESDDDRNTSYYAWFICALTFGSLLIPGGLLFLPLIMPDAEPFATTPATTTTTTTTTKNPWKNLSEECYRNVTINTNIQQLYEGDVNRNQSQLPPKTVCCIYNASRFHKDQYWDYLPKHIPFHICRCVVYWTFGIRSGQLFSRAPGFDKRYGLEQIGRLKQQSSVLLSVGGYKEDSVHFSMLSDRRLFGRFVRDAVDTALNNNLDGINIHWTHPGDSCGNGAADLATLQELIDRLKDVFAMNNRQDAMLSIILPAQLDVLSNHYDLGVLGKRLTFLFFETHHLYYHPNPLYGCVYNTLVTIRLMDQINLRYNITPERICFTASLLFWSGRVRVTRGSPLSTNNYQVPLAAFSISKEAGRAAVFEVCDKGRFSEITWKGRMFEYCQAYATAYLPNWSNNVYITESDLAYQQKFAKKHCALVYDIDFDVYKDNCANVIEVEALINRVGRNAPDI